MTTPESKCKFPDGDRFPEMRCKHCIETGVDFDGERYDCDLCGQSYYLDYEEMK